MKISQKIKGEQVLRKKKITISKQKEKNLWKKKLHWKLKGIQKFLKVLTKK